MENSSDSVIDPRSLPRTPAGMRQAWTTLEDNWSATTVRATALEEVALHERVDDEWSFVETLRHLIFVTDAWVRRTILGAAAPYHSLGLPPDHRIGAPDPDFDVSAWGIDIFATASLREVLAVREERAGQVRDYVDALDGADLSRVCPQHPRPGFPPSTRVPLQVALDVVISEEWAHHRFATRDLITLESAR